MASLHPSGCPGQSLRLTERPIRSVLTFALPNKQSGDVVEFEDTQTAKRDRNYRSDWLKPSAVAASSSPGAVLRPMLPSSPASNRPEFKWTGLY